MKLEDLIAAAIALSPEDKMILADKLTESMQIDIARERLARIDAGEVKTIDGDEGLRQIRNPSGEGRK